MSVFEFVRVPVILLVCLAVFAVLINAVPGLRLSGMVIPLGIVVGAIAPSIDSMVWGDG